MDRNDGASFLSGTHRACIYCDRLIDSSCQSNKTQSTRGLVFYFEQLRDHHLPHQSERWAVVSGGFISLVLYVRYDLLVAASDRHRRGDCGIDTSRDAKKGLFLFFV